MGDAALSLIAKLHPHVALLDIEMPKLDGLGVAREVVKRGLKTEIIFLTLHSNQDLFRTAMDLGCKGYILKDSAVQEVVAGIHAVASGRPFISSAIATDLLQSRNQSDSQSSHLLPRNLTPTELRILRLIAIGKTSKEIGADLSIHYRTVENHRTNICRKLELDGEGANALPPICSTKQEHPLAPIANPSIRSCVEPHCPPCSTLYFVSLVAGLLSL